MKREDKYIEILAKHFVTNPISKYREVAKELLADQTMEKEKIIEKLMNARMILYEVRSFCIGDKLSESIREFLFALPDIYWYCPTCNKEVPGIFVTYEETHDIKHGCGNPVICKFKPFAELSEVKESQTVTDVKDLIIQKQNELINAFHTYSTHVVIMWYKNLDDDKSQDLKLELWGKIKKLRSELSSLQQQLLQISEVPSDKNIPFNCPECGKEIQYGLSDEGYKLIFTSKLIKNQQKI